MSYISCRISEEAIEREGLFWLIVQGLRPYHGGEGVAKVGKAWPRVHPMEQEPIAAACYMGLARNQK